MKEPSAFGNSETRFFYELTPERILEAVEAFGIRCTGRVLTLNSMENRVFEIEMEFEEGKEPPHRYQRFCIAKFYRPGRWTETQILEEHQFLLDLKENDIPAVAPLYLESNKTLLPVPGLGIYCAVFPKAPGRNPDELSEEQFEWLGRLMARLHQVGNQRKAPNRISLNPTTYGLDNLKYLTDSKKLPPEIKPRYQTAVETICKNSEALFLKTPTQRIHGDCHLGNLLWGNDGPFWVDFDDMVNGPCVQDIWLLSPGRDEEAKRNLNILTSAYDEMSSFNFDSLNLIEPLRALRYVHFSTWIGKRWEDPAFPRVFTDYGSPKYWTEQLNDLEQIARGFGVS